MYTNELERELDALVTAIRRARKAARRAYEWPISTRLAEHQEYVLARLSYMRMEHAKQLAELGQQLSLQTPPDRPRDDVA